MGGFKGPIGYTVQVGLGFLRPPRLLRRCLPVAPLAEFVAALLAPCT
jgi:hypothetical protein